MKRKNRAPAPLEKYFLKGFTLVEMLLGFLIFSIIAVTAYSIFHSGLILSKRSDDKNAIFREMAWSLDTLAKDLENMVAYDFSNSYSDRTSFTGTSGTLSLILPTNDGLKEIVYSLKKEDLGSIYKVIIGASSRAPSSIVSRYTEKSAAVSSLTREEKPLIDDLASLGEGQEEVLSPHIEEGSLKFSYAYIEGKDENAKLVWRDKWDLNYLPSGVKVNLTFVKPVTQESAAIERDIYIASGYLGEEEEK